MTRIPTFTFTCLFLYFSIRVSNYEINMEPFEVVTGVIALVDFTGRVSLLVGRTIQEVQGVPESLKLFNQTLQTLNGSLKQIVKVVNDCTIHSEKKHLVIINKISDDCYKLLQSLVDDLPELDDHPSLLKKISAAFNIKLNEKTIKERFDALQNYTQILSLSLNALSWLVKSPALYYRVIAKLCPLTIHKTYHRRQQSYFRTDMNEILQKINALSSSMQKPRGDISETLLAPDEEPVPPDLPRINSYITERFDKNIVAWHESIMNVTRDSSVCYSSSTPSIVEPEHIMPGRNNSVSLEWDVGALSISERMVNELIEKGLYKQAAIQQGESIERRQRLSSSRPFSFQERAAMEEFRADLLLKCSTVACLQEATIILEGLLGRVESLTNEPNELERQGRLYFKLGSLLTQPERIGRKPDMASAKLYLKQAMAILGELDAPPDEDLLKAHKLLVPILRLEGNVIEAEAHEQWMFRRRESNVSGSEVSNLSPCISRISLAPTTSTSTSNSDVGRASKAFEWCERLHLKRCPPGCEKQHCFPYSPQFRFDRPLEDGASPFHRAITDGKLEEVKEMIAEVCKADIDGSSNLLFLAAEARNAPIAKVLLSYGATVRGRDSSNMTVLHHCQVGKNSNGITIAELFLDTDPDLLDNKDVEERTALFMAVENQRRRMTRMLLQRGADPNIPDRYRRTCLHIAVESCAPTNSRSDVDSRTPTSGRSMEMVKILLGHNADPNIRDNTDKTPLYLASGLGNVQVVDQLLKAGADVNGRGMLDETPLITAMKHYHVHVVRRLVASGADASLRDMHRKDAFSYATGPRQQLLRTALAGSV